ncbi:MAG: hypothetical protein NTX50_30210 [Candidatus Sumerlaeota bacterium]|nr:hypothetical protein [Candidatus Sumerlaeota bacterium]
MNNLMSQLLKIGILLIYGAMYLFCSNILEKPSGSELSHVVKLVLSTEYHRGDLHPAEKFEKIIQNGASRTAIESILMDYISSPSLLSAYSNVNLDAGFYVDRAIEALGDMKSSQAIALLEDLATTSLGRLSRVAVRARVKIGGEALMQFAKDLPKAARGSYHDTVSPMFDEMQNILQYRPPVKDYIIYDEILYEMSEPYRLSEFREKAMKKLLQLSDKDCQRYAEQALGQITVVPADKRTKINR